MRAAYDPSLPADWSEQGGWIGWLPAEDYPRIYNPPSGRIWTANARVVDGDDLARLGNGWYELGARARQIRDGLFALERFSIDDMLAIQLDDRALFLTRWREHLLVTLDDSAVADHPARQEFRELVRNWEPRASVTSTGYRLVRAFRSAVRQRVFDMLMQPVRDRFGSDIELRPSKQFEAPLWELVTKQPPHWLNRQYDSWRQLLLLAVDDGIALLAGAGDLRQRTWGDRNTADIRHPLSRAIPVFGAWLNMPREPLAGDSNMPRAQGADWGAAERFAVAPWNEAHGYMHMPAGQSGHPLSEFYRRGHRDWVVGNASPFLPSEARHRLELRP